jgi:hypothetical protein
MITIILVEHDTSIRLQTQIPELYNFSTMTPQVIKRVTKPVDLTKKANPCLRNKEHKQELKRMQLKIWDKRQMNDYVHELGVHKPIDGDRQ